MNIIEQAVEDATELWKLSQPHYWVWKSFKTPEGLRYKRELRVGYPPAPDYRGSESESESFDLPSRSESQQNVPERPLQPPKLGMK